MFLAEPNVHFVGRSFGEIGGRWLFKGANITLLSCFSSSLLCFSIPSMHPLTVTTGFLSIFINWNPS